MTPPAVLGAPTFRVEIRHPPGGSGLGRPVLEATFAQPASLVSLLVDDHVDMVGVCELTFDAQTVWSRFEVGQVVEVRLGSAPGPVFVGEITGYRHAYRHGTHHFIVIAADPLHRLAATTATRVFGSPRDRDHEHAEQFTDHQIVEQVLRDVGCEPGLLEATEPARDYVLQRNESGFRFLRRLAARNGFLLSARQGRVDFKRPEHRGDAALSHDQLISFEYTVSGREVPREVQVLGWSYDAPRDGDQPVLGCAHEIDGIGQPPVAGARRHAGEIAVADVWVDSPADAQRIAEAELHRRARSYLRGRASLEGRGDLRPDTVVRLHSHPSQGLAPTVYVLAARHRLNVGGAAFVTDLQFCSNTVPWQESP